MLCVKCTKRKFKAWRQNIIKVVIIITHNNRPNALGIVYSKEKTKGSILNSLKHVFAAVCKSWDVYVKLFLKKRTSTVITNAHKYFYPSAVVFQRVVMSLYYHAWALWLVRAVTLIRVVRVIFKEDQRYDSKINDGVPIVNTLMLSTYSTISGTFLIILILPLIATRHVVCSPRKQKAISVLHFLKLMNNDVKLFLRCS